MSIEQTLVTDIYNIIAEHFNHTRAYIWKGVGQFVNSLPENSFLLEVGCGNGKNLKIRSDIVSMGIDISENMLTICRKQEIEVVLSDCQYLGYRHNIFDNSISVAVIHHLSKESSRIQAIQELINVTKPLGKIFIQVWNNNIDKSKEKFKRLPNGNDGDYLVRWKTLDNQIYYRYYHLFNRIEFENLLNIFKSQTIIEHLYEEMSNWIVILIVK